MKEKLIFWLITVLFISCCIVLFVYTNNAKSCTEPAIIAVTTDTSGQTEVQTDKININTASVDELITLNGIGDVTAQKIIDYRTENGAFYSVEEIMEVSGIGEAKFNAIKNYITV